MDKKIFRKKHIPHKTIFSGTDVTENGDFNEDLDQLINSTKEAMIKVCSKEWLGIDISKEGIEAIRDKKC